MSQWYLSMKLHDVTFQKTVKYATAAKYYLSSRQQILMPIFCDARITENYEK